MEPQSPPILKEDEVHIWSTFFPDHEKDISFLASILSKDEHERASSFKQASDQKHFLITRGILRCLLGRYLGEEPQTVKIMYGLWGKPYLPEKKFLCFNVSHSRDYALYALARGYEVGIDLEYIDLALPLEEMVSSIFSHTELNYWQGLSSDKKVDFFFKFWVGKEAILKAMGKGWLEGETHITVNHFPLLKQELINESFMNRTIYPYYLHYISGYASALFVEGPSLNIVYQHWSPKELQEEMRKRK